MNEPTEIVYIPIDYASAAGTCYEIHRHRRPISRV